MNSYLQECFRLGEAPRIEEAAAHGGFHRDSLRRRFRAEQQISVGSYVKRCQLEQAKLLLATTALPISAVATQAGYGTRTTLYRVFAAREGVTPERYRSAHKCDSRAAGHDV